MYYYNVTYKVSEDIVQDWMPWMEHQFIPKLMETGFFQGYTVTRLVNREDDLTFAIQYVVKDLAILQAYLSKEAESFDSLIRNEFEEKVLSFQTVLEVIKSYKH